MAHPEHARVHPVKLVALRRRARPSYFEYLMNACSRSLIACFVCFGAPSILPADSSPSPLPSPAAISAEPQTAPLPANSAILPVPRADSNGVTRQNLVMKRAKENPGACDVLLLGDSITQGWESRGKRVWQSAFGNLKCLNLGVSGDCTQHVLWRLENGQIDGLKPKVIVLMIGTNNAANTEGEVVEGIQGVVTQIRARQPETKVILMGILPRGEDFSPLRGKLLQVNQVLANSDDGKNVFFIDLGSRFVDAKGRIPRDLMPDFLHMNEAGYKIWAEALQEKLAELLAR
jgi:lysophospholipase L1-like esterase